MNSLATRDRSTSVDFATHLDHVAGQFPQIKGFDWVLDNLNAEIRRRKVGDIFPDGSSFFPVISGFPSALRHLNFRNRSSTLTSWH